jgi:hypothetical protein
MKFRSGINPVEFELSAADRVLAGTRRVSGNMLFRFRFTNDREILHRDDDIESDSAVLDPEEITKSLLVRRVGEPACVSTHVLPARAGAAGSPLPFPAEAGHYVPTQTCAGN